MENRLVFIVNSLRPLDPPLQQLLAEYEVKSHQVVYTRYSGHATELAKKACRKKASIIVAVGGDGTFSEVVQGILTSGETSVTLALIPNGTGNDFCRGQSLTFTAESFNRALFSPVYRLLDVGKITINGKVRYFLNVADAGFGGFTTLLLNRQRRKGIRGGMSYSLAILRAFIHYKRPWVTICVDDTLCYVGTLMMVAMCNSDTFGNGLIIHPGATPDDGEMNVTLLGDVTFWDYIRNISKLRRGILIQHPQVFYLKGRHISIQSVDGLIPVEADGEVCGDGNLEVDLVPGCLQLLVY